MKKFLLLYFLLLLPSITWGATYCVSSGVGSGAAAAGSDSNTGVTTDGGATISGHCFATLQRLMDTTKATFLHGTDTAIFRGGEYNTAWGSIVALANSSQISIIPNGTSTSAYTTFQNYPGERAVFRRYLAPGATHTEQQLQSSLGAHLPTFEECQAQAIADGVTLSYPWSCWNNNAYHQPGDVKLVIDGDIIPSWVLNMGNDDFGQPVQYIKFDGIIFDAKGIVYNVMTLGRAANHIVFTHFEIANAVVSCVTNPVSQFDVNDSDRFVVMDVQWLNGVLHGCGAPYDTTMVNGQLARKHPAARFYQSFYLHMGGHIWLNNEIYDVSAACVGPLGQKNTFAFNYCHDNVAQAIIASCYPVSNCNWQIYNNIFVVTDTALQIESLAEVYFFNNTVVSTNSTNATCIYIGPNVNITGDIRIENNIIDGCQIGVSNAQNSGNSVITVRNNLIRSTVAGHEIVTSNTMTTANNVLGVDPKFVNPGIGNYTLQASSPAIDAGITDSSLPATGQGAVNQQATDFAGSPRPVGPAIDVGAYEFGSVLGPSAPNTAITARTTNGSTTLTDPTTATTAVFAFSGVGGTDGTSADTSYTFQVQIDGGSFTSNTSPKSYSGLSLQQHTFCVKATGNNSGLTDASPACFSWTVQAQVPPDTAINSSPSSTTTSTDAAFTFSASGCVGTCTFQCTIDGVSTQAFNCTSSVSYTNLSNTCNSGGTSCTHTFCVKAFDDGTSLVDLSPACVTWTIVQSSGSFTVDSCIQVVVPFLNLKDSWPSGDANFHATTNDIEKITATDATMSNTFTGLQVDQLSGSNVGLTGKWHSTNPQNIVSVSCPGGSAPNTAIDSGPSGTVASTTAMFTFSSSGGQAPSTFLCQIDSGGFSACTSPKTYSSLSTGSHTFDVKAVGADTLTDATPATQTWTISSAVPVFTQSAAKFFSLRNNAAGAQVQLGTTSLFVVKGGKFTVELEVVSTVADPSAQGFLYYVSKNGGAYAAVTDSCTSTHICFFGVADASTDIKSDGSAIPTCTASSNTVTGGAVSRRAASVLQADMALNGCMALRGIFKFDGSESANDTWDFRLYHSDGSPLDAYTVTPRVTSNANLASGGF